MKAYFHSIHYISEEARIFPFMKSYLYNEMNNGAKNTGVKRIRIHALRHSHVSLLIHKRYSAIAIAEKSA